MHSTMWNWRYVKCVLGEILFVIMIDIKYISSDDRNLIDLCNPDVRCLL
jgi:hypothetical protein